MAKAFGHGFPLSSIISSATLVVLCLFYIYSAATYVRLIVYPLIERVTYYSVFGVYITNEYIDHIILGILLVMWLTSSLQKSGKIYYIALAIPAATLIMGLAANHSLVLSGIALASLPVITALLLLDKSTTRNILNSHQSRDLILNYFGILGILVGIIGLVFAVFHIISSNASPVLPVRNYAYDVFVVLSSFSPILVLLLISCIPVKLFTDFVLRHLTVKWQFGDLHALAVSRKKKIIYLSLIVLLSIVIAIIPHLPTINRTGQQISVDTGYYVNWVRVLIDSADPSELLNQAFVLQNQGQRPLSLLFIYSLHQITNLDLPIVVEYLPLILGPVLAVAIYFLTRELTSNDLAALISGFATAVSFQVLIGIYAGFYANWMALILGYLSFVFMFRFLKQGKIKNLIIYCLLTLMTMFAHVYTWSILSIAEGAFLSVMIVTRPIKWSMGNRKNAMLLLLVLGSTVAIDIARSAMTGTSGGIEGDLQVADRLSGPQQFILRWDNLNYATTTFVGGQFANFIILGLGLYWIVKTGIQNSTSVFLLIFMSMGILPFLFGDWQIQTRVFYNIPFQIPAALGLVYSTRTSKSLLLSVFVWLVMSTILGVSNYYLVLPK